MLWSHHDSKSHSCPLFTQAFKIKDSLNHDFQDLAHALNVEDLGLFLQFEFVKHIEEVDVRQVVPT